MKTIINYLLLLVVAVGFTNCGGSDDSDGDRTLVLSVDQDTIYRGGQAVFEVKSDGKDITSACTIVNEKSGESVVGLFLAGDNQGTYTFHAEYKGIQSNQVKVEVIPTEQSFRKNVLLQQITSTSCPLCPGVRDVMNLLQEMKPDVFFPMCFHGAYMGGNDPFVFPRLKEMQVELGIDGYAPAKLDYMYIIDSESFDLIEERLKAKGEFGFAISTSVNANGTMATIDVKIKSLIDPDFDCKLAVAIVEDNLVAAQDKYGTIIPDYVHNDVVRAYLTDLYGEKIPEGTIGKSKEFSKQFTYNIPSGFKKENLMVVAYLLNAKQKSALNCQGVKIGSAIDYQYIKYDPNADPWE